MDVKQAIAQLQHGETTFDDVKAQFEQSTFTAWTLPDGDVGDAYIRADSLPDPTDVPSILNIAESAKTITPEQHQELIEIWRRSVTGGS